MEKVSIKVMYSRLVNFVDKLSSEDVSLIQERVKELKILKDLLLAWIVKSLELKKSIEVNIRLSG